MDGKRPKLVLLAVLLGALAALAFSGTALAGAPPGEVPPTAADQPAICLSPAALLPASYGGSGSLSKALQVGPDTQGFLFALPGILTARVGNGLDTALTVPVGNQQVNVTVNTKDWTKYNVGAASPNGPALQATGLSRTPAGVQIENAHLTLPSLDASVSVDGLATAPSGLEWDQLTLSKNQLNLGNAIAISDLTTNLGGPSKNYSSNVAAQVAWQGQALQASGAWNVAWDGVAKQTKASLQNGSLALQAGAMNMELADVSYTTGGAFACRKATFAVPNAGLEGTITGITVDNGVFDFEQAEATYTPPPNTTLSSDKAQLSRFRVNLTKADGGYTVTTETQFAAPTPVR